MGKVSLALAGLFLSLGCSRPANIDNSAGQISGPKLEAKLATAESYPSGTTQTVVISVAKLDDSKGVTASASSGCTASGPAEKAAPETYNVSVNIPARPEDGNCAVRLASVADGAAGSVTVAYLADPEYWKKAAPAMYNFATSKTWTFHSGNQVKIFQLLQASPNSGNKVGVLLVGDGNTRAGMSLSPDNGIVGEFEGCVLEGKINGSMATMKPMMAGSESCKGVTVVTLMVSN
jgi:hypothetical protein